MQKNKINLALLWSKYRGNVTSVNDLILGLDKERFNAIFIYLSGYGDEQNPIEKAGFKVLYLSKIKRIKRFRISILLKLIRILKEHKIDIIHCHAHKATTYGTIAAIFAHIPVVSAHVHGLGRTRNFKRKVLNFLLFRKINRIIPVANRVKEDILKNNWLLSAKKLTVLENSVEYNRFANISISKQVAKEMLGVPADALVAGTVGRLAPTKGLPYLIEAFSKVKGQIPQAHLVLLGDGRLRPELEEQAANANCQDSIHFLGHRNNIEALLRGMDMFVLSSIAEGMPRVILEAMAAKVPCVATNVGGIPEIINSNDVGFLVPPGNPDELARAMIDALNMPENKLEKLIERAQNRVKQLYSHEVVREKLRNLYELELEASIKR